MEKIKKQTAVYMRVSTGQQNFASQENELLSWVENNKPSNIRWYRDQCTGRSMDRPAWNRLQNAINSGKIKEVIVWRLDRLGRSASGLVALFEQLSSRKVNLISLKDAIDLNTASGRLVANIIGSVASYETELRGERVKAGQEKARARGKRWGGSKKGRMVKVDKDILKMIKRERASGTSISAICRMTKLSRPTIYHWLKQELEQAKKSISNERTP